MFILAINPGHFQTAGAYKSASVASESSNKPSPDGNSFSQTGGYGQLQQSINQMRGQNPEQLQTTQ